jgi:hypothetical protein
LSLGVEQHLTGLVYPEESTLGLGYGSQDMKLSQYDNPAQFLERAKQFLEAREAENNLILGISSWLAAHPERIEHSPYFAIVEENGRIVAAAMMTPPYRLVLTRAKTEVLRKIVEDLSKRRITPPGVNGPRETSLAFGAMDEKKQMQVSATQILTGLSALTCHST